MNNNIVFLIPYLKAGGTERQLYYLASGISKKGYNVDIIVIQKKGEFINKFENNKLFNLIFLDTKFSKKNIVNIILKSYLKLKNRNYKAIISRSWNGNLITTLLNHFFNIGDNLVLFLSNSMDFSKKSLIKKKINNWMLNRSDIILSVSEQGKYNCMNYLDVNQEKLIVFKNGLDITKIREQSKENFNNNKISNNKFYYIFVGRLNYRKGLDILLKSFKLLIDEHGLRGKVELIIVGGGDVKKYKNLARKLTLLSQINFIGVKANPYKYIKYSDVFILPSRSEGFPNVLLEAMSLETPVISSNCETGPNEIIDNKEDGLLFESENVEELTEKMYCLYKDDKLREELAKLGKIKMNQNYKIENKIERLSNIIKNL
ncbi:MAG: glycosyltransferase [archaeon]